MLPYLNDPWSDYECRATPPDVTACAAPTFLDQRYVYLLGIYLGDGTIAAAPRNVWRLRVFQDQRYPEILNEIGQAFALMTGRLPGRMQRVGCIELYSN